MLRGLLIAATVFVAGCPSTGAPEHPRPNTVDDTAIRIRIARAEARRAAGVDELAGIATHGDTHARVLALRGLGRIGGPEAMSAIETAAADGDDAIATAAARAIGVAGLLDEITDALDPVLVKALDAVEANGCTAATCVERRLAVIEAIGRAGGSSLQARLARDVGAPEIALARASAFALGRYGRRKIGLEPVARDALIGAAKHADTATRSAAIAALAHEDSPTPQFQGQKDDNGGPVDVVMPALAAAITDPDPEIRATAIAGLARRNEVWAARQDVEDSLRDRDWHVAVEAVRELGGKFGDVQGRETIAATLARRWQELEHGNAAEAQVIVEALRTLLRHELDRKVVEANVVTLGAAAKRSTAVPPIVRGWISCLALLVASHRSDNLDPLPRCEHEDLDEHLRLPLLADLIIVGAGTVETRRAAMRTMLEHTDARVRAAGLGALAAMWRDGDASDHRATLATLAAAIASTDPIIAGAAIEAAPSIYDAMDDDPQRATLDTAIVARARTEREVELGAALFEVIGKHAIAAGADACRAGLAGHPVRARAAATCLKELGEAVPVPAIGAAAAPPVDVADVIGKNLRWHVVTSRGELVIQLRPDVAPWNVATIVALTRRGFYDGLEFHRVVPDFVVQGGDPTMSGWGGPGFTTPAEPSTAADGPGFAAGGIGIADAGRDSGGSQWFVMHSRAPHLDGRFTWIGNVISGQKSADALLIGDKILHATIEVAPEVR